MVRPRPRPSPSCAGGERPACGVSFISCAERGIEGQGIETTPTTCGPPPLHVALRPIIMQTGFVDGTLTVHLPESLVVDNRKHVVDDVTAALRAAAANRLRLDASALTTVDMAGVGALVRVAQLAQASTGNQPVLANCCKALEHLLQETAVLPKLYVVE